MTSKPVFRFAPSPNGLLHLGHAYSALFTYGAAATAHGTCLLRIEDIDPGRSRAEFDLAIREDLGWLGLSWPEPVWRQSERLDVYEAAADKLFQRGLLYPCFCSRRELSAAATGVDPDGGALYPGTCRHLSAPEVEARLARGLQAQYRLNMEKAVALAGPLHFMIDGATPGARIAAPELWGDAVIQRKDTPTSYHLSVVVDDAAQGITHVTRGEDMAAATGIHVLLQNLLGLPTPHYQFHRLILDADGQKLSKSKGSESLRDLRQAGWSPARIRAHLGFG